MNLSGPRCFPSRLVVAFFTMMVFHSSSYANEDVFSQAIENDEVASFIIYFTEKAEVSDLAAGNGNSGRRADRAKMIQSLKSIANRSQLRVADLLRARGAKRLETLWIVNALAVTANAGVVDELLELPEVENIKPDVLMQAPQMTTGTLTTGSWNLDLIGTQDMWSVGMQGQGTVIAFMDTGVDIYHTDLSARYRGGTNSWYDPHDQHSSPYDVSGHGTQVAGLAVGGNATGTAIGVAPGAMWIAVKMYNSALLTSTSVIHSSFQWLLDPDGDEATDDAPDVVNASWGFSSQLNTCNPEFDDDIAQLRAAGISVVFAAGNSGPYPATSLPPANSSGSLSVGSIDSSSVVGPASSRGPSACDGGVYPNLVAPGVNVRTTDRTNGGTFTNSHTYVTGTSAATPHIAGAIALLRQAHPDATVDLIDDALQATATDLGATGADNDYGAGLINLGAAAAYLDSPPAPECIDSDDDGFFGTSDCGTALDCNDADADIHPQACDIKRDGIDQDCDGSDRRNGKACPTDGGGDDGGDGGDGGGGETIVAEDNRKTCSDGLDNDNDGLTDCNDNSCSRVKICR